MSNRFKFTKTALEKLPPAVAGKRDTYYDEEIVKLALRVTAKSAKTYYVVKRVGGEMVWYKLGSYPDMTVEQARKAAEVTLGSFAANDDPAQVRREIKGTPTLNEFFVEYGKRHGQQKRSWRDDEQRYRDYLRTSIGTKKLTAITREMIGRILSDIEGEGKAAATVNNVRALASGLFGKAIEWSYIKENPVRGIKTRKAVKRDRFISANELPRFFSAVALETNATVRDYFLMALLTGARRANVLAMSWNEVDLDEAIWRIPRTKNGEPQNVTLSPEAVVLLTERKRHALTTNLTSVYVFPSFGESGHLVEPKKGWKRIIDRDELTQLRLAISNVHRTGNTAINQVSQTDAKGLESSLKRAREDATKLGLNIDNLRMPDLRIHDLRRTLGSWQAKTGASLAIIGKSLNHKSQATTAIYARLDLDPVRASVNTATAAMMQAAGQASIEGN